MKFFEKLNDVFFGNISRKVSFLTKLVMLLEVVIGIVFVVTGIVKYNFFTYVSYGLGMTDSSVKMGATYIVIGLCIAIFGWLLGLIALGINKWIGRAEFEEALEEQYWEEFELQESQSAGCCEHKENCCDKKAKEEKAKEASEELKADAQQEK